MERYGDNIMINFQPIEIADKKWIAPLLATADLRGCQYNFTNLFAWAEIYKYRAAQVDAYLVVKGETAAGTPYYFYPAGEGEIKTVIEALAQDAIQCGDPFVIAGLSPEDIVTVDSIFPDHYKYTEMRDNFDYVYLLDKLVNLSGDNFRSKRNHINRFKKNNLWSFEPITPENISGCWEMNLEWCKVHGCMYDIGLANETCAVLRCFANFVELGLEGGLIRSEGRIVAYSMGDRLNSDTFDVHIEKAFEEIPGTYQMINREFAALIQKNHPDIIYVNREEDLGHEGLRQAKTSYHPIRFEEKYLAIFIDPQD